MKSIGFKVSEHKYTNIRPSNYRRWLRHCLMITSLLQVVDKLDALMAQQLAASLQVSTYIKSDFHRLDATWCSAVQTPGFPPPAPGKKNSGSGKKTPAPAENMWNVGHRGVKKYNTNAIVMFQLLLKDLSCWQLYCIATMRLLKFPDKIRTCSIDRLADATAIHKYQYYNHYLYVCGKPYYQTWVSIFRRWTKVFSLKYDNSLQHK